jgi:chemotaxis protein MotB
MADQKGGITIIRKRAAPAHGHGAHGAWKVAYADFVTAMMAFFMVMWLMGADEEVKAIIAGYFNNPDISPISIGLSEAKSGSHVDMFQDLSRPGGRPVDLPAGRINVNMSNNQALSAIKEEIEETFTLQLGLNKPSSKQLEFSYEPGGITIKIVASDFFEAGQSNIKPDFLPAVERIGRILAKYQEQLIRIEGHTEQQESTKNNDDSYGWKLSVERAQKVAENWVKYVPNFNPNRVQIAGNSYYRPLTPKDFTNPVNRRVEIFVLNSKSQ